MSHRFFASLGVLAVLIAVGWLAPVPVAGQAPSSAGKKTTATAKTWAPPRTPDGRPDLQGVWSFATITPLERPNEHAGKEVLTDEEAATAETVTALSRRGVERGFEPSPKEGDTGGYSKFWSDLGPNHPGTKVIRTKRTSLIVDPPDGRLPPMTPEAQKRVEANAEANRRPSAGPEDQDVGVRCIMGFNAGPPMIPYAYNSNFQLFQTPEFVVIYNEMVHNARIVPVDGRPHGTIRQWSGDSLGRWEGDTLVVETTHFTHKGTLTGSANGSGPLPQPSSDENLHLVERFTRVDADTLLYEFTYNDPTTWTKSWTAAVPMTKTQDQIYEYACHEGNHGMVGILAGARADDKAAEAAAKKGSR